MRIQRPRFSSLVALLSLSGTVFSFPTAENIAKLASRQSAADDAYQSPQDFYRELVKLREKRLLFNPLTDPVDVTGAHAFQAPDLEGGDQRGPCPGLNALANHNYIPHDGVVNLVQLIGAVNTVFGMGIDLVTVLGVMATAFVGNPLSLNPGFSIGGATSKSSNILGNLLGLAGTPRGLDGSHNWIEGDASATRDDLYVTGDNHRLNMTLFREWMDYAEDGVITMDLLGKRAADRFDETVAINPNFYYGPYTGLVARNAAYLIAGRMLSNHSAEYPRGGHMSIPVLKSFWGVYDEGDGQMAYREGHEQIPANWFRAESDWGLAQLNLDLVGWLLRYPQLASVGGNTGTVNSFAGVDLADATGGVLNAATLLEDNNLVCFGLQVVKTFAPNSLGSLFETLEAPLGFLTGALVTPILDLSCPAFVDLKMGGTDLWSGLLDKFPGASMSGSAF